MIHLQCEAREDYYRTQLGLKYEMEKRDAEIKMFVTEIRNLSAEKDNSSLGRLSMGTSKIDSFELTEYTLLKTFSHLTRDH